nr:MAG TPA: NosL [Caudoviricetes sp.]
MRYLYLPSADGGIDVYAFQTREDREKFVAKNIGARQISYAVVRELGKNLEWKHKSGSDERHSVLWMTIPKIQL